MFRETSKRPADFWGVKSTVEQLDFGRTLDSDLEMVPWEAPIDSTSVSEFSILFLASHIHELVNSSVLHHQLMHELAFRENPFRFEFYVKWRATRSAHQLNPSLAAECFSAEAAAGGRI